MADECRRKTNSFGGGHYFLIEVVEEDITPVKAFSKGSRLTILASILLKSEVKILSRHLSFFLSEVPVNLLLILVFGFR